MSTKRPESNQPIPRNAKCVFKGVMFEVWQWQQKMYDGKYKTFEKVKRHDTVNVIAVTEDDKIIITKQEQPGIKPFYGLPGGRIDKGEDALAAAKRELLEETGYVSDDLFLFDSFHILDKIDWASYIFIARNAKKLSGLSLDSGEKITLEFFGFKEFMDLIYSEQYRDKDVTISFVNKKFRTVNSEDKMKEFIELCINGK